MTNELVEADGLHIPRGSREVLLLQGRRICGHKLVGIDLAELHLGDPLGRPAPQLFQLLGLVPHNLLDVHLQDAKTRPASRRQHLLLVVFHHAPRCRNVAHLAFHSAYHNTSHQLSSSGIAGAKNKRDARPGLQLCRIHRHGSQRGLVS